MAKPMTSRQRILSAMRRQEVDRVPCSPRIWAWLEAYYGDSSWQTLLRSSEEFGYDPDLCVGSGVPDHISAVTCQTDGLRDVTCTLRTRDDDACVRIDRTFHTPAGPLHEVIRRAKPGRLEYGVSPDPVHLERLVKDRDDLARLRYLLPDPAHCDVGAEYARMRESVGERGLVVVHISSALDHRAGDARAMTDMMVDYYQDRPFLDELIGLCHEHTMAETRAVLECGAEVIFASWFYTSLSVGWSPKMFGELFVPLIKEHVDLVHRHGALYDYYDDGKCSHSMEMIASCGVDVLETLTPPPVGDVDLADAKRRIGGRTCLKGHIDLLYVIKHGSTELIDRTVREAIEIGKPGGGFILGTSDSIREGTPLENVQAYFNAARKYGEMAKSGIKGSRVWR